MSYPKRLLRLPTRGGLLEDIPPHETGPEFLTGGNNVLFRNGYAERLTGFRAIYTDAIADAGPGNLMHAQNVTVAEQPYWLIFDDQGGSWLLQAQSAERVDNGLLLSQGDPWRHTSTRLNGVPVYSNAGNEPVYWSSGGMSILPGWTATESCEFIVAFKFHLFALNISGPAGEFPNLIKWSAAAEPGTVPASWAPASDNEAGDVELSDLSGPLVCAYPLGDALAIYKATGLYLAQYVGGNSVYSFRKSPAGVGAISPRAVADIGGAHLVIDWQDIVITDGTSKRSIGEQKMKRWMFQELNTDNVSLVFCRYNPVSDEVLIGFPTTSNLWCDKALVYDIQNDSFGKRDLANVVQGAAGLVADEDFSNIWADATYVWTAATQLWGFAPSSTLPLPVLVSHDTLEQQDSGDTVTLNAEIIKDGITFGEPERVKFVKRLHVLKAANSGTLFVRVTARMTPNGPQTATVETLLPEGEQIVNTAIQGRYLGYQIRSIGDDVWGVTAVHMEAELRGYH